MGKFREIVTCDRSDATFNLKNKNKSFYERSHYLKLQKLKNLKKGLKKKLKVTKIFLKKRFFCVFSF